MKQEIIKPSYIRKTDFKTRLDQTIFYDFNCLSCDEKLQIKFQEQIQNDTIGKNKNVTEQEYANLKNYYNVGLLNKSREGGSPVFDKACCAKCKSEYYTYVGIDEPRNSVYHVQIQGIIRKS